MISGNSTMVEYATKYLALRRGLGYQLRTQGVLLLDFARYADETGHYGPITIELATSWTMLSKASPPSIAQRLSVVRQFARHRVAFDPLTEVPPAGLLGSPVRRKSPHIYTDREIAELLLVAGTLRPQGGLRSKTYIVLFSLLASTGLRISECRHLTHQDVDLDAGLLIIRETKFRKTRLVPLHLSAVTALRCYVDTRNSYLDTAPSEFFFRTDHAGSLRKSAVEATFGYLRTRLGWIGQGHVRRPRIHDLRHTFAVRRLVRWYEEGADIDKKIFALSTYLGHAKISDTYWYLSAVPELLAITSRRFEHFSQQEWEDVQ